MREGSDPVVALNFQATGVIHSIAINNIVHKKLIFSIYACFLVFLPRWDISHK